MQKLSLYDSYFFLTLITNVFQIFGSIIAMYQNSASEDSASINFKEICIGLGTTLCWFSLVKYFSYNNKFKTTMGLLSSSLIGVLKFFIGILPLFMGFVFLGRCLFWKYEKYESTRHAIVVLFSMMAGDIIDETFTDTGAEGFLSIAFEACWMILFMCAVHNVFISILSGGFTTNLLEDRYKELFDQYSIDSKEIQAKLSEASPP